MYKRQDATYLVAPPARERVQRMRVCFPYADEQDFYVTPLYEVSEKPYLVRYNIPRINEEVAETCKLLWRHAQVNLLDVAVDEAGILTPSFIVLEPDYKRFYHDHCSSCVCRQGSPNSIATATKIKMQQCSGYLSRCIW